MMKKICSPDAHRHDIQVFYFIMLFILTIGYIDKVYKSVSSKRKPTHPSVGNVCVCCCLCVWAGQRRRESTAVTTIIFLLGPAVGSQLSVKLYKVKIYSFVSAKRSLL